MSHSGGEAVREIIDQATEVQQPEYISFGCYKMDSDGLAFLQTKGSSDEKSSAGIYVSGPFEILGRVRDPKGEGWARLLRWTDEDNRTHRYPVSDADLHGDVSALCANLASRGLRISTGSNRKYFTSYLNDVFVEKRVTVVPTTGWHDIGARKVFVLPNDAIGSVERETVMLEGAAAAPFESRGTLADWQKGVGSLVASHSRPVFAVSVAFAGPLLGLLGLEGGGFNLYGQSSRGKTTSAQAAASVWGKGDSPGFVRQWRSTANALEAAAAIHTDAILVLDELGTVEAKEAAPAIYSLTGGTGKGRSRRDGSLRQSMAWRTIVLSTGEIRLTDKLIENRQPARAGQQVRLVDIHADAGKGFGAFDNGGAAGDPKALADQIKAAAQTSYGTAGPEFVRRLIADDGIQAGDIKASIDAFRRQYAPNGADGQVLRVADRFGLVAVAGELASELQIVPWKPGEALDAAGRCFTDWFDGRGGGEAGEVQAAISKVRLYFEQHGDSRFEPVTPQDRPPVHNRTGWRRGDGPDREWLIPTETWKAEVTVGHNPKFVARVLADRGMLRRANDGYQCVERIQGRPQRVYVVTASILSEAGHE